MANKRARETQEKRRREHDKQLRQASKEADRRERTAKKKADKIAGIVTVPVFQSVVDMMGDYDLDAPPEGKKTP